MLKRTYSFAILEMVENGQITVKLQLSRLCDEIIHEILKREKVPLCSEYNTVKRDFTILIHKTDIHKIDLHRMSSHRMYQTQCIWYPFESSVRLQNR